MNKAFWKRWHYGFHVTIILTFIYYFSEGFIQYGQLYSKGYLERYGTLSMLRLNSKGIASKLHPKKDTYFYLNKLKSVITRLFDIWRRLGYLLYFKHSFLLLCVLILSNVVPIALFHNAEGGINSYSIINTIGIHFFLCNNKFELFAR